MKLFLTRPAIPGLCGRIAGIRNATLRNAVVEGGSLRMSEDSQVEFAVKEFVVRSSALMQVLVEAESRDVELTPKLYLDYGDGFAEEAAFHMTPAGTNAWMAYLPAANLLGRVRLDLSEEPGLASVRTLVVHRAALTTFVADFLGNDPRIRQSRARRKVEAALARIDAAAARIAHGDEGVNHAIVAGALAVGVNQAVDTGPEMDEAYLDWIDRYETLGEADLAWMAARERAWARRPLLSVVMPVYDPPLELLEAAVASLQAQAYANWELCLADDASPNGKVRDLIVRLAEADPRIRYVFREENGHISAASNSAAALATGEFIVLMDNDDALPPHALWAVAHYVDANPGCRMLYSDEDKISLAGFRCEPYHKGAFDRFLMYGHNMFSHLGVYERALFESVGGFRKGFEGSQDYDLTLRCSELCAEEEIVHIPHVLYHWRQVPGSTSLGAGQKNYAFEAAKRAINEHFSRMGYPLESVDAEVPGVAVVRTHSLPDPAFVSVVIPTRDGLDDLRACIDSLLSSPDPLSEIVIVDNGSSQPETLAYLEGLARDANRFTIVRSETEFNFSHLCNLGVSKARGDIVCLLNNDTELLAPNMFERVRAWLSIPDVGVVGARLLYPDGTLQHFGVYAGTGDHGVASHAHLGIPDAIHSHFSKSRLLQQFSVVTGACLFMRKADYDALGGLDETLAVAYNDVDLCLKARRAGLKVVCDPSIRLLHKESKSRGGDTTPAKAARLQREAERMVETWGEALSDPFYNPNFTAADARFTLAKKARQPIPWKDADGRDAARSPGESPSPANVHRKALGA